ncbi:M10 family metallopeptidase C-terminal domain-containing protein [Pontibacterium sp. N1Y112]|uniref:M10 family metallopeptidase C-terminal domain-containing protein n=1 Tax=Pontibacterium sinense TaxID=2781979 RepID=A0A8J7FAH5_9GAMM|nr:M10 family metallopeptidase C-terminal domain-containing protein [Pontibacterium sinense]MBE9395979.1 M10 family metallopeptidase C-terminal domain-containing protein [Pontibacterium sinense]
MGNRFIEKSGDSRSDSLLSGAKWGEGAVGEPVYITYSFPEGDAYWSYTEEPGSGFLGLNKTQQKNFKFALNAWQEVSKLTFIEIPDSMTYGDIRVAYTAKITGNVQAYAYFPGSGTYIGDIIRPSDQAGDIWINPELTDLSVSSTGYATLIHEVGHALGLKHSFESEGGFPAINPTLDNTKYTVMSYTEYTGAGYIFTEENAFYYTYREVMPTTPMLYDILAAQYMYGVDTTTRAGDDVYTFTTQAELKTIWDAGGADEINLSNQNIAANLNLNAGEFSDIGQRQMTYKGPLLQANENIAIAFGVIIENATGTRFDDVITGNSADNIIDGGLGDDRIDGGSGIDTAKYQGARDSYVLTQVAAGNVTVEGQDGLDTLENIEKLSFSDGDFLLSELLASTATSVPTTKSEVSLTPAESETAYYLLEIGQVQSQDASVSYATRDGTALAGEDYVATSGIATIAAGSSSLAIAVQLIDDAVTEDNETFSLVVSNPVGGIFSNDMIELVAQRTIIDNDIVV